MSDQEKIERIKRDARDVIADGRTPLPGFERTTEHKWETQRVLEEKEKKERGW